MAKQNKDIVGKMPPNILEAEEAVLGGILLDPDAISKALQITKELKGVVEKVKVLMLKDDLKYGNDRDIELLNMA